MLYMYIQNNASLTVHLCAFCTSKMQLGNNSIKSIQQVKSNKLLSFNNVNALIVFLFSIRFMFIADENCFYNAVS